MNQLDQSSKVIFLFSPVPAEPASILILGLKSRPPPRPPPLPPRSPPRPLPRPPSPTIRQCESQFDAARFTKQESSAPGKQFRLGQTFTVSVGGWGGIVS
jgi:hypothetical protein